MVLGIKTNELNEGDRLLGLSDELVANLGDRTVRLPIEFVPHISNLLIEFIQDDTINITDADHRGRWLVAIPTNFQIDFVLPDVNSVLPNVDQLRGGGFFCGIMVANNINPCSVTAPSGQMRARSPVIPGPQFVDTLFVGSSQIHADEAVVRIYKRPGFWVMDSVSGFRTVATEDQGLIGPSLLSSNPDFFSGTDRNIVDGDNKRVIWLTNAAPGSITFQADIAVGTEVTVINQSGTAVAVTIGSHTLIGDNTIAANQGATIIVGDTVSGTNRNIFVAASS